MSSSPPQLPPKLIIQFHQAIDNNSQEKIISLLSLHPLLLSSPYQDLLPLQRAAYVSSSLSPPSTSLLSLFLDRGVEVDGVVGEGGEEGGESALTICAEGGDLRGCELLLERGADPCFVSLNNSVLHGAVRSGKIELVKMILEFGGNPEREGGGERLWGLELSAGGKRPVEIAQSLKFREIEELLEGWGGSWIKG